MTAEVSYGFDDEQVERVTSRMGGSKVRRLPVLNVAEAMQPAGMCR